MKTAALTWIIGWSVVATIAAMLYLASAWWSLG
jgi:hypothetical protein